MARVLIVGEAGGREEGVAAAGHVVEVAAADPDRLATLTPALEGVSVLCWLFGGSPAEALHGDRLAALVEYLVDTPVRGVVYERSDAFGGGEEIVRRAERTFRMPCAVIAAGEDLADAVGRVLSA